MAHGSACEPFVRQSGTPDQWRVCCVRPGPFIDGSGALVARRPELAPWLGGSNEIQLEALQLATAQRNWPVDASVRIYVRSGGRVCRLPRAISDSGEQNRSSGFLSTDP